MAEWSNEKSIQFTEDYRALPCLWNANSDSYKDKAKRQKALQFLKAKYEFEKSKAVLNKIKSFRSYFRRVHKEYMTKKRRDSDADVPQPSWFLYKHILFILDGEEKRPTRETFSHETDSKVRDDDEHEESSDKEEFDEEPEEADSKNVRPHTSGSNMSEGTPERKKMKTTANYYQDFAKMDSRRQNITHKDGDPVAHEAIPIVLSVNQNMIIRDHISIFGEYVASKIRSFGTSDLQSYAQMCIQEVLYDLGGPPQRNASRGSPRRWRRRSLRRSLSRSDASNASDSDRRGSSSPHSDRIDSPESDSHREESKTTQ